MNELPGRIPPHNLDAERAILGALILEGHPAVEQVAATALLPSDFFTDAHRTIFGRMRSMITDDQPIDLVTLAETLRTHNELPLVGGHGGLALLIEQASILAHLPAYVEIVIEKGRRRDAIQSGSEIVALAYDEARGLDEVISACASATETLARSSLRSAYDPADDWHEIVEAAKAQRLRTGLRDFDRVTNGLDLGMFAVIAGRTSHGKTSVACDLAKRFARHGATVDFITLEEPRRNISARLIASLSGVATTRLRDMQISPSEFDDAERAVRELQALPLEVRGLTTIRSLNADTVLAEVAASRAQVVILDHLHQISTDAEKRTYGLEEVVKRLQMLAIRDNKLVLALAQLSREIDKRQGPPVIADIADSSAIEKAARLIALLYWRTKHDENADPYAYEVYIAKQSNGPCDRVDLRYEYQTGRFMDRE